MSNLKLPNFFFRMSNVRFYIKIANVKCRTSYSECQMCHFKTQSKKMSNVTFGMSNFKTLLSKKKSNVKQANLK